MIDSTDFVFVFFYLLRSRRYIEGLYTEWEEEGEEDDIEQVVLGYHLSKAGFKIILSLL